MQLTKINDLFCANLPASTIANCLVAMLVFFLAPSGSLQAADCVYNTSPSVSCGGSQWIISDGQVTVPFGVEVTASSDYISGVRIFSSESGVTLTVQGSIVVTSASGVGIDNYGVNASIVNSGAISSAFDSGILNWPFASIVEITNRGTIEGGTSSSGIYNAPLATIGTLTNTGTIGGGAEGIRNDGTINTLNNLSSSLSLTSNLPNAYNVIIVSAASYGKLITPALNDRTVMIFGISSLSTTNSSILNTTLGSVLSGVAAGNLLNTNGTSNGYTFALSETSSGSGIWDLLITACSVCSTDSSSGGTSVSTISSGTSVGLASIGTSPVLSGGTLVLLSGDNSSTAFSVTSASTIQNPTSGSATLSGVFSGPGGLTFIGNGSTTMSGANTYSGGTTVSSGTLVVAGPSPPSSTV